MRWFEGRSVYRTENGIRRENHKDQDIEVRQSVGFFQMNKWLGKDGLLKKTGPDLWVLSGAFGILNAAGLAMYAQDHLPRTLAEHGTFWLTALAGIILFYVAAKILYVFGPRLFYGEDHEPGKIFLSCGFRCDPAGMASVAGFLLSHERGL